MSRAVLGILTTYPDGSSCRGVRWPQWGSFAQLIRSGEDLAVLFTVFSPEEVWWPARTLRGRRGGPPGTPARRWRRQTFHLPDCVYIRVPTRVAENRPSVR